MKFYNFIALGLMIGKSSLCIGSQTSITGYNYSPDDATQEYICKSIDGLFNYFIDAAEFRERQKNNRIKNLEVSNSSTWRNTQIPTMSHSRHIILLSMNHKDNKREVTPLIEQLSPLSNFNAYTSKSEDSAEDSDILLSKKAIVQTKKKKTPAKTKKYDKQYQEFLRKGIYQDLATILKITGKSGVETIRKKVRAEYVHEALIALGQTLKNGDTTQIKDNLRKKIFLKNKKILLVGLRYSTTFQFNIENSYHTLKEEPFSIDQEIEACLLK